MPGIRDDIIIKRDILAGMFNAAAHEAEEVERHSLLADCIDLDKELHAAYLPFKEKLEWAIEEMKNRVTAKVIP